MVGSKPFGTTLNQDAGGLVDRIKNSYPDQVRPPSRWAPEPFRIEGQTAVTWTDIQPRLGVAYDLFGDKRTAVKASASRYGQNDATGQVRVSTRLLMSKDQFGAHYIGELRHDLRRNLFMRRHRRGHAFARTY